MSRPVDFCEEVRRYVELQGALLSALRVHLGWEPANRYWLSEYWLADVPRLGEVTVQSRSWRYFRHGAGIRFEDESGRVVDAHDHIDMPEFVDAWRLRCYFGSLGRSGTKLLERALGRRGVVMLDAVEELLARARGTGDVVACDSGYRFMSVRA